MPPASCSSSASTAVWRRRCLRRLSGAAADNEVVRLQQEALRRTAGGARLSARYTHRVAIANSRLIAADSTGYLHMEGLPASRARPPQDHDARDARVHPPLPHPRPAEGLPSHPPLWAVRQRRAPATIARARELLAVPAPRSRPTTRPTDPAPAKPLAHPCPCCGGRMIIIETFEAGTMPRIDRRRPATPSESTRHDRDSSAQTTGGPLAPSSVIDPA